ncbi:hypothetical protein EN866_34795 [Mesorhizobium sp. M2D.F.Ca.ET.223.01.1.1]|uniref:hypothetical protein n=1 Tax=Mesorhizobium sp. M2D.F.Ca.ET.223.01.1.1 TaxID=2563940 RepID=UPI001091F22A|nr:hypothetical protein [Mesorhizobium sp. M2D.F.Ca.ET.223.01.1.1]TGP49718.1 hypothetical protein EN873_27640 [bacterium M00.F.Ca.ET.230.01.1.1]TGR82531.1 hypothetical protein EN866_34795 [Mesorhizobium sp. M2D.F.Ca.ET.223.01.1.1]TGT71061.1 hypothetical protein EN802_19180 [bacterium M00.F.Ca.ET.159.01.1.1]TGT82904.1 hypothetical protein EN800_17340 [bacterium M00.F.Ca.ET.157.01.1.1]
MKLLKLLDGLLAQREPLFVPGPYSFRPEERVKRVLVKNDPKRYETVYGTVIEHIDRVIKVRLDDGTEYQGDDYPFLPIDRWVHYPEPIAYQNPNEDDWGPGRTNEWSTKPWKIKRHTGLGSR